MFSRPVAVGNGGQKPGGIGIGPDQAAVLLVDNGVHRADLGAYAARIGNQIEHGDLVGNGDIAAAPGGIGAALLDVTRQFRRRYMTSAIIRFNPQPFQPEFVNQGRFAVGNRIADHLGIGHIFGHAGKIDRMRR